MTQEKPRANLDTSVQYVKGVGEKLAQILAKIDLLTLGDLYFHLPRRHEDRTQFRKIAHVQAGEMVSLSGKIITADTVTIRKGMSVTKAFLEDGSGTLELIWFNQPYIKDALLKRRESIVVYGMVKETGFGLQMETPEWEDLTPGEDPIGANRIVPVYPLTEGIGQKRLRAIIYNALNLYLSGVQETLPPDLLAKHQLLPIQQAIRAVHFPDRIDQIEAGRMRLVFEEFLIMQLAAAQQRAKMQNERGIALPLDETRLLDKVKRAIPFELTSAQERVIHEIWSDMKRPHPMNRLLQGDVGSGKTVVAASAILAAIESDYQAAIMAPTEILAEQHHRVLHELFRPFGIPVELLVGRLSAKQKEAIKERVASGRGLVAVGTHAVIQDNVEFARLGLAIIDEQHRFGVMQRAALRDKGLNPHVLVMTATPIPRTLTMTLYGDLDVSIIDQMPPGRKPVKTHWKYPEERLKVYEGARRLVEQGRQVYVICPLVEESEKLQVRAAEELAEHLQKDIFPDLRVGLLHGRMKSLQKDEVMEAFRERELDILVSTTVIEVGVDVPNAAAMIVEDADRFGLAQLHQLRGRVGRGEHQSFCVLIAKPKSDEGMQRMEIMARTNNGFLIAEEDLRLRGPGEIYGTKQSGLPAFRVADLIKDMALLEVARHEAFQLIELDPTLEHPANRGLKTALERHRHRLAVATVS